MPGMATLVGEDAAAHLFRVTTGLDSVIAGEAQILRQVRAAYSSAEGVPVQFLADHLEVLYDLDIAAAAEARRAGLRYRRVAMPNTRGSFIRALAAVARTAETRLAAAHA